MPATQESRSDTGTRKTRSSGNLKLDLGCGERCQPGFEGVDIKPVEGVVHVTDLFKYPWPFDTKTVKEVYCSHLVEHIPHYRPEYEGVDGWWMFFNELHRICKRNAKVRIQHPYLRSERAFWDPTHTRYICENTWYYLTKEWRESQKLENYDANCDFEIITIQGVGVSDVLASRHAEAQEFARIHYWNLIGDLVVDMRVIK